MIYIYQLPPVGQPALFDTMIDAYARLYCSGSLWKDEFEMIELDEMMRQRVKETVYLLSYCAKLD